MQRELRRLAHGTNEQANADHCDQHPRSAGELQFGKLHHLGEHLGIVQCPGEGHDQANTKDKTKIAHTVHQKRLHVGKNGGWPVEPEANQQIRHQAHGLPSEKQLQQVVAHHQHQHGEREQGNVGKETVVAFILVHVTDGVDVNHEGHKSHHAHHHCGQAINQETYFHLEVAHGHPGVDGLVEPCVLRDHGVQDLRRQHKRYQYTQNGDRMRSLAAQQVSAKPGAPDASHDGTHQGGQGNGQKR